MSESEAQRALLASLKRRGVSLLAQREQSEQELRRKLLAYARRAAREEAVKRGSSAALEVDAASSTVPSTASSTASTTKPEAAPDSESRAELAALHAQAVTDAIEWLRSHGYVNDARFAESRINARASRHGITRIRNELARLGVELPAESAQTLRATELDRARALWQRRFGERPTDAREHAKQARFLIARGFAPDVVAKVLRTPTSPDD